MYRVKPCIFPAWMNRHLLPLEHKTRESVSAGQKPREVSAAHHGHGLAVVAAMALHLSTCVLDSVGEILSATCLVWPCSRWEINMVGSGMELLSLGKKEIR